MILYDLHCRKGHGFEAWFPSSASYEEQGAAGKVRCPVCGSRKVEKALMAPKVAGGRGRGRPRAGPGAEPGVEPGAETGASRPGPGDPELGKPGPGKPELSKPEPSKAVLARQALTELRRQIEENCDYVGPQFAEEARKIHYGEAAERSIYGETSDEEAGALADEGIGFRRIPWLPKTDA